MNYLLFCKSTKKTTLDILNIMLFILSVILLFVGLLNTFKIVVVINLFLYVIKIAANEQKETKKDNLIILNRTLAMDNENIYIINDRTGLLMYFFVIAFMFILFTSKASDDMIYFFFMFIVIFMAEVSNFLISCDNIYLKKNIDNLFNVINGSSLKYQVIKIEEISKSDNGTYIVTYGKFNQREVIFSKQYENYDELINQINGRCH